MGICNKTQLLGYCILCQVDNVVRKFILWATVASFRKIKNRIVIGYVATSVLKCYSKLNFALVIVSIKD
jgi:hypothetical protein